MLPIKNSPQKTDLYQKKWKGSLMVKLRISETETCTSLLRHHLLGLPN